MSQNIQITGQNSQVDPFDFLSSSQKGCIQKLPFYHEDSLMDSEISQLPSSSHLITNTYMQSLQKNVQKPRQAINIFHDVIKTQQTMAIQFEMIEILKQDNPQMSSDEFTFNGNSCLELTQNLQDEEIFLEDSQAEIGDQVQIPANQMHQDNQEIQFQTDLPEISAGQSTDEDYEPSQQNSNSPIVEKKKPGKPRQNNLNGDRQKDRRNNNMKILIQQIIKSDQLHKRCKPIQKKIKSKSGLDLGSFFQQKGYLKFNYKTIYDYSKRTRQALKYGYDFWSQPLEQQMIDDIRKFLTKKGKLDGDKSLQTKGNMERLYDEFAEIRSQMEEEIRRVVQDIERYVSVIKSENFVQPQNI